MEETDGSVVRVSSPSMEETKPAKWSSLSVVRVSSPSMEEPCHLSVVRVSSPSVEETKQADWSSLPEDILENIYKRRQFRFVDHFYLRYVCSAWRSFALQRNTNCPQPESSPLPYLMLPYRFHKNPNQCSFFSLYDHHKKVLGMHLPKWQGKYCCNSSQGWLVFIDNTSPCMSILHPINGREISLPPLFTLPGVTGFNRSRVGQEYKYVSPDNTTHHVGLRQMHRFFVYKVVLAPNPIPTNYTAMVIFERNFRRVAFCKSGEKKWILVEGLEDVDDIIHYNGMFYACDKSVRLFTTYFYDDPIPCAMAIEVVQKYPTIDVEYGVRINAKYLVQIYGKLALVVRERKSDTAKSEDVQSSVETKGFSVYTFLLHVDGFSIEMWDKLTSIGHGRKLFVGENSALASDSPECKHDCIYFTGDFGGKDFGVYDLRQRVIEPFPSSCPRPKSYWQPPVWVPATIC